jgi:hypothetical protein
MPGRLALVVTRIRTPVTLAVMAVLVAPPDPPPGRSDAVPAEHPDGDQRQHGGDGEHHRDGRQR